MLGGLYEVWLGEVQSCRQVQGSGAAVQVHIHWVVTAPATVSFLIKLNHFHFNYITAMTVEVIANTSKQRLK